LDKQFDEKKSQLLKNLTFSNNNTINNEEEEKFKEELLSNHNYLKAEEEKKFEVEKSQKLKFLEDGFDKKFKKDCDEIKKQINKKIVENTNIKKKQNETLKDKIKILESQTEDIKIKISKAKEDQEKAIAMQSNSYGEELAKEEADAKQALAEFKMKKESDFKLRKQKLIADYDKKIHDIHRKQMSEECNQLSQVEINDINNDFKDKKQRIILENEEKINRTKDEIVDYYNNLLIDEKSKMQISLQNAINSLKENSDTIKQHFQSQIEIYNFEQELSMFSQIPYKISELTNKNNEMFSNLSNFNKLIFEKVFRELENNKDFGKIKNKNKIYKNIFEYFSNLIFQIVLDYSINDNKDLRELLDVLIDRITSNMDKLLASFPVDKRVQLSIEIKDTNIFIN